MVRTKILQSVEAVGAQGPFQAAWDSLQPACRRAEKNSRERTNGDIKELVPSPVQINLDERIKASESARMLSAHRQTSAQ